MCSWRYRNTRAVSYMYSLEAYNSLKKLHDSEEETRKSKGSFEVLCETSTKKYFVFEHKAKAVLTASSAKEKDFKVVHSKIENLDDKFQLDSSFWHRSNSTITHGESLRLCWLCWSIAYSSWSSCNVWNTFIYAWICRLQMCQFTARIQA